MKLTKRGSDFLVGILVGTAGASLLDIKIVLAICLTLVFSAIMSMIILARATAEGAMIESTEPRLSCLKGQETKISFRVKLRKPSFTTIRISKLIPSRRMDAEVLSSDETGMSVRIRPRFAGRSTDLPVRFAMGDPLGFFRSEVSFQLAGLQIDCIPFAILREVERLRPVYTSVGEREGRTQGLGLEFYSIDSYKGTSESKDIFWKKVAASPDEKLLVKLHSQNVRKKVTISVFRTTFREEERLDWMDSACEGVALIGKAILQMGSDLELLFDCMGKVTEVLVSDLVELLEGIMNMSTSQISALETTAQLIDKADICVTGFKELENLSVAVSVAEKPALLIPDPRSSPSRIGDGAIIYDEYQDFRELVSKVVGK